MKTIAFLIGLLLPVSASAAGLADVGGGTGPIWSAACTMLPYCGSGASGLAIMTGIVSNVILWTIGPAAVLIILYASIRIITSGGNDETVRKSMKEIILYAVLGLIFAILADTIINYIYAIVTGIASS